VLVVLLVMVVVLLLLMLLDLHIDANEVEDEKQEGLPSALSRAGDSNITPATTTITIAV